MLHLWKYTQREVQRRPARTILTLLGIAVGVATVVAITTTTRSTKRAYREMFNNVAGKAQLEVIGESAGGFKENQVTDPLSEPDVKVIKERHPIIHTHAALLQGVTPEPVLVLGVNLNRDVQLRSYKLEAGRLPNATDKGKPAEVLIGATKAKQNGIKPGDKLTLLTKLGYPSVTVVGLLSSEGAGGFDGGSILIMPLKSAQNLFGLQGKVNTVQIVLKDGVDTEQARIALEKKLQQKDSTKGFRVQTPYSRGVLAESEMLGTELALNSLSVVSLVGGAFVVLNSFLMSLGERRKQLAILRALGTTRRQITRLLLREALILGIVGSLIGLVLGAGLASALVKMQEEAFRIKFPPLQWTAEPFIMGMIVGPGMALLSTWLPARRAGQRSPLEAMVPRRSTIEQPKQWPRYVGLGLICVALVNVFGFTFRWWEPTAELFGPSFMLILIGFVLALPWILKPLQPFVSKLFGKVLGVEGSLAIRQLERQPSRTSLTVGVLFIGVIITVGFGISLLDSTNDIEHWYDGTLQADFYVRSSMPNFKSQFAVEQRREVEKEIRDIPGVTGVRKTNFLNKTVDGQQVLLLARDFAPSLTLDLSPTRGTEAEIRKGLAEGQIVLGTALSEKLDKGIGDEVTLKTDEGPVNVRVTGVVKEYTAGGMACYLNWSMAKELFRLSSAHVYEVYADKDRKASVGQTLKENYAPELKPGQEPTDFKNRLIVQSNEELRADIDKSIESVMGFLWSLILMIFVVAALGIINTLTMNVYEQTRELGMLRAIGVKRGQLKKMIVSQAMAMAVLSIIPGVLVGVLLAWVMNLTTPSITGHHVDFNLHPGFVLVCAAMTLGVSFVAAWFPARRASRINMIHALQYE